MNELDNIHKHLYEPELYSKEQLPEIYRNDIQYLIECLTAYKRIGLTLEEITAMKSERDTLKKALELACRTIAEDRSNRIGGPFMEKWVQGYYGDFIHEAQEQEGRNNVR